MKTIVITNETSREKIEPVYIPLIEAVLSRYQEICKDVLLDVRLLGSVARGEARVGHSDIDFLALVNGTWEKKSLQLLDTIARDIQRAHPCVSRVEMDVVHQADISAFQRFVLESDSLHLFGQESIVPRTQVLEAEKLARLVTPNISRLISGYRAALLAFSSHDQAVLSRMSRVIGKDLLKCLRYLLITVYGLYNKNIAVLYEHLLLCLPDQTEIFGRLFTLYMQPGAEKQILLDMLDDAQQNLIPLLSRSGWSEAHCEDDREAASLPTEPEQ